MSETVAILMATYNGEKHIREQLESVLGQTYGNICIFISDDGSNDATVDIINEYQRKDERIHLEHSSHKGACMNFSQLLNNHKDYNYVMFCDQDDVWDKYKVEKMYRKMRDVEKEKMPFLVYCEKSIVDENLIPLKTRKYNYEDSLRALLCQCHIYGCTMMLNKRLIEIVNIPVYATMHDHWISLVASVEGKIVKVDEPLILYRQHANNVTGGINQFSIRAKIKNWNKVNSLGKREIEMCYKFCLGHLEEPSAEKYVNMLNVSGCRRIVNAIRFKYKLDHCLATLRGFFVLMSANVDKDI